MFVYLPTDSKNEKPAGLSRQALVSAVAV